MTNFQEQAIAKIEDITSSLGMLNEFLRADDGQANSAISVLRLQIRDQFGDDDDFLARVSPFLNDIEQQIKAENIQEALEQTRLLEAELTEMRCEIEP